MITRFNVTMQKLLLLFLLLAASEASSSSRWLHCGYLDLPEGGTLVTTDTAWLHLTPAAPPAAGQLYLHCHCPPHPHSQPWTVTLQITNPATSYELTYTLLHPCSVVGCLWNSLSHLILPGGVELVQKKGVFEHAQNGLVYVDTSGELSDAGGWVNLSLPAAVSMANLTLNHRVNLTQAVLFDVWSCVRGANAVSDTSVPLSVRPLSHLASPTNGIHSLRVVTGLTSPSSRAMEHGRLRTLRQAVNTPPRFHSLYYTGQINENNEPGVIVGTVQADDPDAGVEGQIMYSLMTSVGGDISTLSQFEINAESGDISVNVMLDHEVASQYTFQVKATDGGGVSVVAVFILDVVDLNDNPPTFQQGSYHNLSVAEDTQVGTKVIELMVVDEDSGSNGQVTCTLPNNPDQAFSIVQSGSRASLMLRESLDYETTMAYHLTVLAHDGGNPSLSSSATIEVRVLDVADSAPVFNATSYSVSVSEDTPPITHLLTVGAVSADSTPLARLEYFIESGNYEGRFSIDQTSGALTLVRPLDYERTTAHHLQVRAQSILNPTLRSFTTVHISVTNVNDHAPSFSQSQYTVSVLESVPPPVWVVTVTAEDEDVGAFGEVSYSFFPDTPPEVGAAFGVDPQRGEITTRTRLDKETRDRYTFSVEARDGGNPPNVSRVMVVIHVTDVNDERPIFSQSVYSGSLPENKAPGSEVIRVEATDSDSASLQHVIQSGNHGNAFAIEASTGVITNRIRLDREQRSEYTLVVMATDQLLDSVPVLVVINVTDENDEIPIFNTSLYTPPPVPETTPIGMELLTLLAMDRDVGSNAMVLYTSSDIDPAFSLDPMSGCVTIARSLDYDSGPTLYSFTVQATDGGNPPLSSSTRVIVTVLDENDNPPIIDGGQFSVNIEENLPPYTPVLQLSASDADSGLNSDLVYSVVGDSDALRLFGVDQGGLVYTLEPLDRERRDHYQVRVRVSDRGVEPRSDYVTITVTVDDVIDDPPIFSLPYYIVDVTMATPMNSELVTVSAMTRDLDSSLIYHITSGNRNLFSIDQGTGVIITATTLDPVQDAGEYTLHVTAQHIQFVSRTLVFVTVRVDDGVPVLQPLTIYFNAYEPTLSGRSYIGRVSVRRSQEEVLYSFSLVNSDPCVRRYFDISEMGGDLVIIRGVATGKYSLNVTVTTPTGRGHGEVVVYVRVVTNSTLRNAVVATFAGEGVGEETLVTQQLEQFARFVAKSILVSREAVELVGVASESERRVQLAFAVRDPTSLGYLEQDVVLDRLLASDHLTPPSFLAGYETDVCADEPCSHLQRCKPVVTMTTYKPEIAYRSLHLGKIVYISQPFTLGHTCHCRHGFDLCTSVVDLCNPSPCYFGGECVDDVLDYYCRCPQGTYGKDCSVVCPSLSCDPCGPAPCLYDSVCMAEQDGSRYTCDSCPWGSEFSGPNCELTTASFELGSFVALAPPTFSASLKFSLEFATVSPNGLLLYSGRFSGRHDYISVELVIGQVQVGVSFGPGAVTVIRTDSSWLLSDGEWHGVEVELRGWELRVRVSGCGQGSLQGADYYCDLSSPLPGSLRTLDVTTPLYVGGLESHIQSHLAISTSYTGCIANVVVGGVLVDFNAPLRAKGVEIGCPPRSISCSSSRCPLGECVSVWNGTLCKCEEETPLCGTQPAMNTPIQLHPGYFDLALDTSTTLTHFSVAMRTRSSNAVLARMGVGSLEIVQGSVQFRRSRGAMLTALTLIADAYVNDGLWHEVSLSHTSTHTQLAVDGQRVTVRSPEGGSLPLQSITLGADQPNNSSSRFIGCLGRLVINQLFVNLGSPDVLTSSGTGYTVTHGGVTSGCGSGDPCMGVQCPAHSLCASGWREYTCECDSKNGYQVVGGACVKPCEPNPCLNGGMCLAVSQSSPASFQCNCVRPYTGVQCEDVRDGECEAGFYGVPPSLCQPCVCDPRGVVEGACGAGICLCKADGDYYSRPGDVGCKSCDCHVTGSLSSRCDPVTGQCMCRRHVTGRQCDRCADGFAGMDETGCKEATFHHGRFSMTRSYHDNSHSSVYFDLASSVSEALERELLTFGLPGRFQATIIRFSNSSGSVGVEYQIASFFSGDHTHLPRPSFNTIGSAVQVIVQSGWVGPHPVHRHSHSLLGSESCDLYPALCGDCPEGTIKDEIICRPVESCVGADRDRDGVPDECDNCTFTFNPDQDPTPCAPVEGVCPGGVVSHILWSSTPSGSVDLKPCLLPSTGYASRECGVGGVWGNVDSTGCLSPNIQQLLIQSSALDAGQLLSLDELDSLLTRLTAHSTTRPLTGGDVQAAGRLLSQLLRLILVYPLDPMRGRLLQNCSLVASNLLLTGDPPYHAPWLPPVEGVEFTAEDFLVTIEQLFAASGNLSLSLSQGHLAMSPYLGESPTDISVGEVKVSVQVPEMLATPTTTLGVISNLGQWLSARFTFNTDSLNFTVATPLLVVQGSEVSALATPINMTLPFHSTLTRPEGTESTQCVHWEHKRGWSTSGCGLLSHNSTHTTCTCSHLTVFSVLLPDWSFEPLPPPPGPGYTPQVFTYVVLSLVAMAMLISFLVLACLPSLHHLHTTTHLNLLLALSLSALVFLVGVNRVEIPGVCATLGACLMFLLLSCLSWLLAESLIIARFLLTPPPRRNFLVYLIVVGWLLPVFLCAIPLGTLGVISGSFLVDMGHPNYCWLRPGVIYAFIAPVLLLLILYTLAITFSFVMLSKMEKESKTTGVAMTMNTYKIRTALLVSMVTMLLIMAVWAFGLLAVYVEEMLEYPFVVLHAALALFLFLVLCCNSQVREAVRAKLSRRTAAAQSSLDAPVFVNNSSSAPSTTENDRRLTGTYAEVELVTRPHSQLHQPTRHITPYMTRMVHGRFEALPSIAAPTSTRTPVTPCEESSPKQEEDNWLKFPSPIPLSPLTFSTESHDSLEPVYSQVRKSRDADEGSISTDIDHVPASTMTEGHGSGGDSPQSYLKAEPSAPTLQAVRSEDPLWYRQRDSTSVEVDPLPYETAVRSPVRSHDPMAGSPRATRQLSREMTDGSPMATRSPMATKQRSHSEDWLAHRRIGTPSSATNSPATLRTRPLPNPYNQSDFENSPASLRTHPLPNPHDQSDLENSPASLRTRPLPNPHDQSDFENSPASLRTRPLPNPHDQSDLENSPATLRTRPLPNPHDQSDLENSPASLRTRPLPNPYNQSDLENSPTMPAKPSVHKLKEVHFKPLSPNLRKVSAGRTQSLNLSPSHPHVHHRLSDQIAPPSSLQLGSTVPSSLRGQVTGNKQYHKHGPSSAKEGPSEIIRHADGSETVRSLV